MEMGNTKTNLKQGDWVLYNGKPRQVSKFMPFGPNEQTPAVIADARFDLVELAGIKKPVYVSQVQIMRLEAAS
jgi:hypothetical protein